MQESDPVAPLLRFEVPLIVVGGAGVSAADLRALHRPGFGLVGADSGGDAVRAAGLVPDAVIGDFDSLADPADFGPETRLMPVADQNSTDFEKVLASTRAPLTLALGMTGGRLDHTLAALHAVTIHAARRRIVLVDGVDVAAALTGDVALDLPVGTRVSIYPLAPIRFSSSRGLFYPLDGLAMAQGETIGTSNHSTAPRVAIAPDPGCAVPWLLIVPRAHLASLLDQLHPAP